MLGQLGLHLLDLLGLHALHQPGILVQGYQIDGHEGDDDKRLVAPEERADAFEDVHAWRFG